MASFLTRGSSMWQLAKAFCDSCFVNPFDEERRAAFKHLLQTLPFPSNVEPIEGEPIVDRPELDRVMPVIRGLVRSMEGPRSKGNQTPGIDEAHLFSTLSLAVLYFDYRSRLHELIQQDEKAAQASARKLFTPFAADFQRMANTRQRLTAEIGDPREPSPLDSAAHVFGTFFQLRRAYHSIPEFIKGQSRPARQLRAATWESIFSCDFQLYVSHLYGRMHDINTLIIGPSGTGKDRVAQAIGFARYLPFSPEAGFRELPAQAFRPVNLAECSSNLIESELFGHQAASFSGAVCDREGVFERCEPYHTLFLDEIGELEMFIQVKLLRVLQERTFYRVGDRVPRFFGGKVIAATNRDLGAEMTAGRFRQDLYYRLCSDVIRTPSLRHQLDDSPEDLPRLVRGICTRVLGTESETPVDVTANRVVDRIRVSARLGAGYPWPGNFRELEQCVRSVLVHGDYIPASYDVASANSKVESSVPVGSAAALAQHIQAGTMSWDELLNEYVALIHSRSQSVSETARKLGKHRSTVEKRIKLSIRG